MESKKEESTVEALCHIIKDMNKDLVKKDQEIMFLIDRILETKEGKDILAKYDFFRTPKSLNP